MGNQRINATIFPDVLSRLGLNDPSLPFELSPVVVPVSIVDQDVDLTQVQIPILYGTPSSEGEITNPASGAVLADTGQLAAGTFAFTVWMAGGNDLNWLLQHRDAANAANIWSQYFTFRDDNDDFVDLGPFRVTLALNERLRVISNSIGGAGNVFQCNIFSVRISP